MTPGMVVFAACSVLCLLSSVIFALGVCVYTNRYMTYFSFSVKYFGFTHFKALSKFCHVFAIPNSWCEVNYMPPHCKIYLKWMCILFNHVLDYRLPSLTPTCWYQDGHTLTSDCRQLHTTPRYHCKECTNKLQCHRTVWCRVFLKPPEAVLNRTRRCRSRSTWTQLSHK